MRKVVGIVAALVLMAVVADSAQAGCCGRLFGCRIRFVRSGCSTGCAVQARPTCGLFARAASRPSCNTGGCSGNSCSIATQTAAPEYGYPATAGPYDQPATIQEQAPSGAPAQQKALPADAAPSLNPQ